jgi:hypothetical protein
VRRVSETASTEPVRAEVLLNRGKSESSQQAFLEAFGTQGNPIQFFLMGVAMSENWIILLGVICARTYEEFNRAYSLLHKTKGRGGKSSVVLWKVISGQMPSLNSEALKRLYERRKNEKK